MHSSRMRTDCGSSNLGGRGGKTPCKHTPTPCRHTHLRQIPPSILHPHSIPLPPRCMLGYTPCGQTDACENITFPATLWVNITGVPLLVASKRLHAGPKKGLRRLSLIVTKSHYHNHLSRKSEVGKNCFFPQPTLIAHKILVLLKICKSLLR